MQDEKIYNKKRAERRRKVTECYPNIENKTLRFWADIICILKLQLFTSLVYMIRYYIFGIFITIGMFFILKNLPLIQYKIDTTIKKEEKELLKAQLTTPNQKKWLNQVNEFRIFITDKTCETFKLNKDYLETKRGFYNIKFNSNHYSLKFGSLQKEKSLLNGLDETLSEMCKLYEVDDLWIFAKSYADKSDNPNKKYLLDNNYLYNKIEYYHLLEINNSNRIENVYWIDKINLQNLSLKNDKFINQDLIYLRSKFVGEEILKKFLNFSHIDVKSKQFGILEGDILDEKDEEYRRTDIYITFCKDN